MSTLDCESILTTLNGPLKATEHKEADRSSRVVTGFFIRWEYHGSYSKLQCGAMTEATPSSPDERSARDRNVFQPKDICDVVVQLF